MRVNAAALDLIKEFEGLRLDAYQDSVGVWTIGYGTTAAAGLGIEPRAGQRITQAEAEWYLQKGVNKFADSIFPYFNAPLNQNQFGACVSLAYNIGPGAFKKSSVLRHINAGNMEKAADSFLLWNKAGGVKLKGLVRRRAAERALFLTPTGKIPAPIAPTGGLAAFFASIASILASIFGGKK
jgi:lysozyme